MDEKYDNVVPNLGKKEAISAEKEGINGLLKSLVKEIDLYLNEEYANTIEEEEDMASKGNVSFILKIISWGFPSLLIAIGGIGWLSCNLLTSPNNDFCNQSMGFIYIGIILQIFWLLLRFKIIQAILRHLGVKI